MVTEVSLPILEGSLVQGSPQQRQLFAEQMMDAFHQVGCFYLRQEARTAQLCSQVLDQSQDFFALPPRDKLPLHIQRSPHFRGYSEMKNERDWREQMHFGREQLAHSAEVGDYWRLQGPNLWPNQLGPGWRETVLRFLQAVEEISEAVLSSLAAALELAPAYFAMLADEPAYLLMKLICYHPQTAHQSRRVGVAPHCDWSWITFLLQDEVGGLQIRLPTGAWADVPPVPHTFVVNVGELIEILTGGYLRATPHRVVNPSSLRSRISIPVFINPPLTARIAPVPLPQLSGPVGVEGEHVHRVVNPRQPVAPFVFGDSEWQRKGLGHWCYDAACLGQD